MSQQTSEDESVETGNHEIDHRGRGESTGWQYLQPVASREQEVKTEPDAETAVSRITGVTGQTELESERQRLSKERTKANARRYYALNKERMKAQS